MLEVHTIDELREALAAERMKGRSIGFVPTMGYFHEGHITLMKEAKKRADTAVVSIFVNPTQFGPNEDLDKYPRDLDRDRSMAQEAGVDILFTPSAEEIYPEGYASYVDVIGITRVLCGKSRPGHFRGVATVVTKLLNIVQPNIALFGEKDWQQLAVIKKLVADLNIDIEIVGMPTVREEDGLAMSSRNIYLAPEERSAALIISKSLKLAQNMVDNGEGDASNILSALRGAIEGEGLVELEYLEICDPESLVPVKEITADTLIAIAARVGAARLIDNALIRPQLENTGDLV
ncbi:MAG: pantoate--beta-alanine ligase [Actinobacteria bacterium]|nr:pantoate--beta-alanine ligase [Actinomycetota bacterium]